MVRGSSHTILPRPDNFEEKENIQKYEISYELLTVYQAGNCLSDNVEY